MTKNIIQTLNTDDGGKCTFTVPVGSDQKSSDFSAGFEGTNSYLLSSSEVINIVVGKSNKIALSLSASNTGSGLVTGSDAEFTVTVSSSDSRCNGLSIQLSGPYAGDSTQTMSEGSCSFSISVPAANVNAGTYTYTASIVNSNVFKGSATTEVTVTTTVTQTELVLSASNTGSGLVTGSDAEFTVTVSSSDSRCNGLSIQLSGPYAGDSTQTMSEGSCSFSISVPAANVNAGTYTYTASIVNSSTYKGSATTSITVTSPTQQSVNCSISSNKTSARYGETITLTATVTDSNSNLLSGINVNFYQNNLLVGNSTTTSTGKASISVTVTAQYGGNFYFQATTVATTSYKSNTSNNLLITVYVVSTNLVLTSSASSVSIGGDDVTFTATLTEDSGTPISNQSVEIYQGSSKLSTVTTNSNGQGSFTQQNTATTPGSWNYYALFNATKGYATKKSDEISVSVYQQNSSLTMVANSNSFEIHSGQSLVISGKLTSNGAALSGQQIILYQGSVSRGTTTTDSSGNYVFTIPITATTNGSWSFYTTYAGNTNITGTSSSSVTVSTYDAYVTSFTNIPSSLSKGDILNPRLLNYQGLGIPGAYVAITLTNQSTNQSKTYSGNTDTNGEVYGLSGNFAGLQMNLTDSMTIILNVSYAGDSTHNNCTVTKNITYTGGS